MKNEDLKDLFDCIKIAVGNDAQVGGTTTEYRLPAEALAAHVQTAIFENFSHFNSASIVDGKLILAHPVG